MARSSDELLGAPQAEAAREILERLEALEGENAELEELRRRELLVRDQLEGVMLAVIERRNPRTLDERMAAVQKELEDVPRRGHADVTTRAGGSYAYDYITEADLMAGIRPLLARHGIATYYSDRILSVENGMARVEVTLRLRANREEVVLSSEGVGTDTGDKHANKAKTSAMRYLLWKTFLQPSDEDPEQDNTAADEAKAAEVGRQAAARQRTEARSSSSRRAQPQPQETRGRMIGRLNELTVEVDKATGAEIGTTMGNLPELARRGLQVDDWPNGATDPQLVAIGKQLAAYRDRETERREALGADYTPAELELEA